MSATFDITVKDNTGIVKRELDSFIHTALEAVGVQAVSHAATILTDTKVYGGIDLTVLAHEKDNSRRDTGQLVNSLAYTVIDTAVYIGSNLQHAVWNEIGTGVYASQPGGRKGWWVYIEGQTSSRGGGRTYATYQEAAKTVAILRKKGLKAHATQGLYPVHFLKKAASEYLDEYQRIFANTLAKIS